MIMNRKIKYLKIAFLSIMVFIISGMDEGLRATHIVGADMTFSCQAKDWYEINLTVRRDCIFGDEEATFEDPAYVGIFDAIGTPLNWLGSLGAVKMDLISVEDIPVDELGCAEDGSPICVSEARYIGRVFLPFREKGYVLAYQRCCRNQTLTNILNPLETGNTSFVCLTEETLTSCNTSPVFGDWPELVVCSGEPIVFDASATDAEGDSLSYMLYTPHSGASIETPQPIPPAGPPYDTVEYAPGFSLGNLLGNGTPLRIDAVTGLLTGTPGISGQFLVGILVEEWRNGESVSKTRRNFEYNVRICNDVSGLNFDAPELQCEGLTVQVTNTSDDLEQGFRWNFNYPSEDPAFFSTEVSPSFTYPERGDYVIQLVSTTQIDTCGVEGILKNISVIDSDLSASFTSDSVFCTGNSILLNLTSTSVEPDPENQIVKTEYTIVSGSSEITEEGPDLMTSIPCNATVSITIKVTSSNGCTAEMTQTFEDIDTTRGGERVDIDFLANPTILCPGESSRIVANPDTSLSYSWSPIEGLLFPDGSSDPIAQPLVTTLYTVTVTDGTDTIVDSVLVQRIDDVLDLSITNNSPECSDPVSLSAVVNEGNDSSLVFEWATDSAFLNIVATGADVDVAVEGQVTFYLRADGPFVCGSNIPSITIDNRVGTELITNITPVNTCVSNIGGVAINGSDPEVNLSFIWTADSHIISPLDSSAVVVQSQEGESEIVLTYRVMDDRGCTETREVIIPVIEEFILSIGIDSSVCPTGGAYYAISNIDLDSVSLEWSQDPEFGAIISTDDTLNVVLITGSTLYLRGTSVKACESNVASLVVTNSIAGITDQFEPINLCESNKGTVQVVSADTATVFSITWDSSPNITSEDLNSTSIDIMALDGDSSVVLTYTIIDNMGCTDRRMVSVPVISSFEISIGGGSGLCGSTGTYYAISNVDLDSVRLEWSLTEDFSVILSTDDTIMVDFEPGTMIFLRGTSTGGCDSNVATETISDETGGIEVDAPGRICAGDTADVDLILPAGDDIMVMWDPAPEIISDLNDARVIIVALNSSSDSLRLSYTVTEGEDCTVTGRIAIPYSTVINPNPQSEVICGTFSAQQTIDSIYQDNDVFWDFGTINGQEITSTLANPVLDFDTSGIYRGLLTSTMETCNFDPVTVIVEIPEILELTSDQGPTELLCMGDSLLTLGADGNGNLIVWTDGADNFLATGDSVTVDVRTVNTVIATISDIYGCTESLTFNVGIYEFDIDIQGPQNPVCSSEPVDFTAIDNTNANLSFVWTSANGIISGDSTATVSIDPSDAEDLVLTVTHNDFGCIMEFPFPVTGGPEISAEISANPGIDITNGESVTLTVSTDAVNPSFMWTDGNTEGMRVVSPTETTTYSVKVTDETGCTADASITINVMEQLCTNFWVPNAFTPNGDGSNDLLFVRSDAPLDAMEFIIIDRWGKEIFTTTDQSIGWNGLFRQNGKELAPDVYAYRLKVTCDGRDEVQAGNISLIR